MADPPDALYKVQFVAVRMTFPIEPGLSLKPTVSTTSVSPSHVPIESPIHEGIRSLDAAAHP